MATQIGELFWKINGDTKDFDKNLKKSETGLKKFGGVIKKFAVGAAASFAAVGIAKLGQELINAASDAEETSNKFAVVFQGLQDAGTAAEELAESYGLSRVQSQGLLADTSDLLQGFGIAKDESLDLSLGVQALAADLASFTNFSGGAEGASQALTKALLGERESVKALGIAITESELKRFAEDQGLVYAELDKGEKAFLTFDLAVKQSANSIGDFERSQDSFANQMRIAKANVSDLSVAIGEELLPAATEAVTAFNTLISRIIEAREETQNFINAETAVAEGTSSLAQDLLVAKARLDGYNQSLVTASQFGANNTRVLRDQIERQEELIAVIERKIQAEKDFAEFMAEESEGGEQVRIEAEARKAAADARAAEIVQIQQGLDFINRIRGRTAQLSMDLMIQGWAEEYAFREETRQIRLTIEQQETEDLRIEEERRADIRRTAAAQVINGINDLFDSLGSIRDSAGQAELDRLKVQIDAEEQGSEKRIALEEEYDKKSREIERKAAVRKKAQGIFNAVVSTAQAVIGFLANPGGIPGIALSVLAGITGAAQVAAIAAEPLPAFESGGIVPGTSTSGDNVDAKVNSGEMILTEEQQARLFALANGGGSTGSGDTVLMLDSDILAKWIQRQLNGGNITVPQRVVV